MASHASLDFARATSRRPGLHLGSCVPAGRLSHLVRSADIRSTVPLCMASASAAMQQLPEGTHDRLVIMMHDSRTSRVTFRSSPVLSSPTPPRLHGWSYVGSPNLGLVGAHLSPDGNVRLGTSQGMAGPFCSLPVRGMLKLGPGGYISRLGPLTNPLLVWSDRYDRAITPNGNRCLTSCRARSCSLSTSYHEAAAY